MPGEIINGQKISTTIKKEIKEEVEAMKTKYGKVPGLAVVLVGSRTDSQTYVRMKKKVCEELGITPFDYELPEDTPQVELIKLVKELNSNPSIHGILVQLPLPSHINEELILSEISLEKDVDGFHPLNIGKLAMKDRSPLFVPCTPKGCIELLDRSNVEIEGKNAVVLGRSNIVGMPVSMLLLQRNATVTICHSRSKDLPNIIRQADILIAAVGRAEMVKGDWLKPGCVVIDVGMNSKPDPTNPKGTKLCGDCDFESCKEVASKITPVPRGVGPMTIAMLMKNTLESAKRQYPL